MKETWHPGVPAWTMRIDHALSCEGQVVILSWAGIRTRLLALPLRDSAGITPDFPLVLPHQGDTTHDY
jgi:hypothetical protein